MIGYLFGKVVYTDGKKAIIQTSSGVGYEINYAYYLKAESDAAIFIHHNFTESDQSLWGFRDIQDKKMFELLKSVNKVGASKAYPLVTTVGTQGLIEAITFERSEVLTQAQGIGKKMAEQIILSLKDKIQKFEVTPSVSTPVTGSSEVTSGQSEMFDAPKKSDNTTFDQGIFQEALMALESLGYQDKHILNHLKTNYDHEIKSSGDLVRRVLKEL